MAVWREKGKEEEDKGRGAGVCARVWWRNNKEDKGETEQWPARAYVCLVLAGEPKFLLACVISGPAAPIAGAPGSLFASGTSHTTGEQHARCASGS